MFAIVEICGKQYRVTKDMRVKIPLQDIETGKKMTIDRVLAYADDKGDIAFGTPLIKNINISATVLEHGRDKKIIVFKKKRRKGYQKKRGHRQDYSLIQITDIGLSKKPTAAPKISEDKEKKPEIKQEATQIKTKKPAPVKSASKKTQEVRTKKPKTTTRAAKSTTTSKKTTTKTKTAAKTSVKAKTIKTIKDEKEKKDGS